jgi:hypothetical protein
LTQNIISNPEFSGSSGWIGTKSTTDGEKAAVEKVFGRFSNDAFVSVIDDM